LQGDFEEELRRMSVARAFDQPKLRDACTLSGSPEDSISSGQHLAHRGTGKCIFFR